MQQPEGWAKVISFLPKKCECPNFFSLFLIFLPLLTQTHLLYFHLFAKS